MGNEALLERFLKKFPQDENYQKLCAAMEASDWEAALTAAHTLKGICGNLSIAPLFDLWLFRWPPFGRMIGTAPKRSCHRSLRPIPLPPTLLANSKSCPCAKRQSAYRYDYALHRSGSYQPFLSLRQLT